MSEQFWKPQVYKEIRHAMRWIRINFTETNYWKKKFKVKKCIFIDLIHSNGTQLLRDLPDFLEKILLKNDRVYNTWLCRDTKFLFEIMLKEYFTPGQEISNVQVVM